MSKQVDEIPAAQYRRGGGINGVHKAFRARTTSPALVIKPTGPSTGDTDIAKLK